MPGGLTTLPWLSTTTSDPMSAEPTSPEPANGLFLALDVAAAVTLIDAISSNRLAAIAKERTP